MKCLFFHAHIPAVLLIECREMLEKGNNGFDRIQLKRAPTVVVFRDHLPPLLCSSGRITPLQTLSCQLLVAAIPISSNSLREASSLGTCITSKWCLAITLWPQTEVCDNYSYVRMNKKCKAQFGSQVC